MCSHYRRRAKFGLAWKAYARAVFMPTGWRYFPYAVLLLLRSTKPASAFPGWPLWKLLRRVVRNPKKYFRSSFWIPMLRTQWFRLRHACVYSVPFLMRSLVRKPLRIYVFPERMNRYLLAETYVAWKVFAASDLRITSDPAGADLAIAWHPSTQYELDAAQVASLQRTMRVLNARCTDIQKSTVDRHFEAVFGYSLEVDPRTHAGPLVRKSQKNGAHDGEIVEGPLAHVDPGYVYQRLVCCRLPKGIVEWRVFIVGARVVATYRLYARPENRFAPRKNPEMTTVEASFNPQELTNIHRFCVSIGLDFGVVDVLRDQDDDRIYICDCNPTATGPVATFPLRHRLRVVRVISQAFHQEYLSAGARSEAIAQQTSALNGTA